MITIKEYAKKHGISYEAVRKQINRYRVDLGEHIFKKNKTQFLDEVAEEFLNEKRANNPIIIMDNEKDERMKALEMQNESFKNKIMELQDQIIKRDDKIMELSDKVFLLTTKNEESEPIKKSWWKFWNK